MIRVILMVLLICSFGCASSPDGTKEIMTKIEADRKRNSQIPASVSQGRPVFIEVAAYPQVFPEGDIWTGGVILLNIGRENLHLGSLVEKYQKTNKPVK